MCRLRLRHKCRHRHRQSRSHTSIYGPFRTDRRRLMLRLPLRRLRNERCLCHRQHVRRQCLQLRPFRVPRRQLRLSLLRVLASRRRLVLRKSLLHRVQFSKRFGNRNNRNRSLSHHRYRLSPVLLSVVHRQSCNPSRRVRNVNRLGRYLQCYKGIGVCLRSRNVCRV